MNAGRLGYRYGGEILATTTDGLDHGCAARPARDRPLRASRGRGRPRRQSLDEPTVSPGSLAGGRARRAGPRAFRPARDRWRHHRSRDRERGRTPRSPRRPRRPQRLRRRHLERVVEADPRRPPLPPARRREARPRGARRASSTAPRCRAAPRPADPLHVPGVPRGPVPAGDDPGRALDVLDPRGRQARRPRQTGARPEERSRTSPRRPARVRRLPGLVDARRTALPRQRDGRGRGRRDGAQLRRGRRLAKGRWGRAGSGAAGPALGRLRLGRGPRCRQRHRALARRAAPPGGTGRGPVRSALEGRPRDPSARRAVVVGAHDPARPDSRHVRLPVGGHAPARHDRYALRR